jgi:hypothetical protein
MTHHTKAYYDDLKRFPARRGRTFHHFHYKHIGRRSSVYLVDGMYLPNWVHVPIIHRLLGGSSRAGGQPFGKFPNMGQRVAHMVCRAVFSVF